MLKKIITFFIFFCIYIQNFAQQNPPNIKWKQIKTENAIVIFPFEVKSQGQKIANLIDYLYKPETKTLNTKPKQIPILIYNQTTESNGFVDLQPRRSAWYITPNQTVTGLGNEDWFSTLATHEYRHVVQFSKLNHGMTKFLGIFFGESAQLLGQTSIPYWFFEGDAVCTETALGNYGRGKNPQFEMGIRTLLINDKLFSYNKAKLQSYKNFYPNHYNLGWIMTSYARMKFGSDIWDKTLNSTSWFSIWPYAFSMSLKHFSGLNEKQLYKESMTFYQNKWKEKLPEIELTQISIKNTKKKKCWTNYSNPDYLTDGTIITKKSSLDNISAFYKILEDGSEKKIKDIDAVDFSISGNKSIWVRNNPDLRWDLRDFSDIVIYDFKTNKETQITKFGKYFSPALSPDCKLIAAVEFNEESLSFLVILDAETGNVIKKYSVLNNEIMRTPFWSNDGNEIVFTKSSNSKTGISILNYKTEIQKEMIVPCYENIGQPVFYENFILYNSPFSGIDNIYAIDTITKQKYQVTSVISGAYNPKIKDNKMLFSNYSVDGYDIAEIELNPNTWKKIEDVKNIEFDNYSHLIEQEQNKSIIDSALIPNKNYEITDYKQFKHILNIHSWGFYPANENSTEFRIFTGNLMNTILTTSGVNYDKNEKTYTGFSFISLQKYFPIFDFGITYGNRNVLKDSANFDFWTEYNNSLNITLPFNLSKGLYTSYFKIKSGINFTKFFNKENREYFTEIGNSQFVSQKYNVTYYKYKRMAYRDLNPKFGFYSMINYRHTPFKQKIEASLFSVSGSVYLPGIFKHNSIKISVGYEQQKQFISNQRAEYYPFASILYFSRDYELPLFEKFTKFSCDYIFPIWYPDFGIGSLLYFKRLRSGFFYDYSRVSFSSIYPNTEYQSAGIETFMEFHIFRKEYPFEIGYRISYLVEEKEIIKSVLMFTIPIQ